MANDFGGWGDYGEYSGGFSPDQSAPNGYDFPDMGGWGDYGEYSGGFSPENTQDPGALAASYDLMSNPNFYDPNEGKDKGLAGMYGGWRAQNPNMAKIADFALGRNPVTGMFNSAAKQDPSMFSAGAFSMLGNAVLPGIGGLIGGVLGGQAGKDLPSYAGGPAGFGGPNGMGGGDMAETLMQLYGASRANSGMGDVNGMNTAVQDQVKRLSEIYGPNSPYATQMRQTLARKDAAAGRNSQYGPREAQLQALLADKQTQATDAMSRAAQSGQTNALNMAKYKQQLLGQRLGLAANIGKKTGLFNMFGSGTSGSGGSYDLGTNLYGMGSSGQTGLYGDAAAGMSSFIPNGSAIGNAAASGGNNWFDDFIS